MQTFPELNIIEPTPRSTEFTENKYTHTDPILRVQAETFADSSLPAQLHRFMLYPMGLCLHMESSDEHSSGSRSAAVARSVVLGLHVSGPGCEGVGFEADFAGRSEEGDGWFDLSFRMLFDVSSVFGSCMCSMFFC